MLEILDIIKLKMPWVEYQKSDIFFYYHHKFKIMGIVGREVCIEDLIDETRFVVDIQYLVKCFPEDVTMDALKATFERTSELLDKLEKEIKKSSTLEDTKVQKEIQTIKNKINKKLQNFI